MEKGDSIKIVSVLGTGWLGLPLSECLVSNGFNVKGSTRSSVRVDSLLEKGISPFLVDVSTGEFGLDCFFDAEIMVVNIPFKGVPEFTALIEKIEKSKIRNVIFISSTSVYGNKNGVISEEDYDCLIPGPLLEIENLFSSNKNFCTTVVRFGGLIGYSRNPALFFKDNRLVKNPESNVNLIHRDDCINIICSIIKKNAWGAVYNCCSDTHPTKREFYTYAAKISGVQAPNFSVGDEQSYKLISNSKVKKDLDYSFLHPNLMDLEL